MSKPLVKVSCLLLILCSSQAWSAGLMKQGLWEVRMKSDMTRSIADSPDGSMTSRLCISKEMAEREEIPGTVSTSLGCQAVDQHTGGGSYSARIVCDSPRLKGEGSLKALFKGKESYTSTYDFKGSARGRPLNMHQESSGRWLSADCGSER